jgi:hypothetical protein
MEENEKNDDNSLIPVSIESKSESARDPLRIMIEIAKDDRLSPEDKKRLIMYSQNRFTNRRKMAYMALYGILASLGFLLLATIVDGISSTAILESIGDNKSLFAWIEGFLAAIVAAYYGVSAWRPAS